MRRLLMVGVLVAGCSTPQGKNVPIAPGGSVADFDRGSWGEGSPSTGTPAGARDTIGHFAFGGPDVVRPAPLPPMVNEVSGTPEAIRRLQRALADKGYYHGPINGVGDASTADALRRYRADTGKSPLEEEPPDGGVRD